MARSTPVPIAKVRPRPPPGRTKPFPRKPGHTHRHEEAGMAVPVSLAAAAVKAGFPTVTKWNGDVGVRGFALWWPEASWDAHIMAPSEKVSAAQWSARWGTEQGRTLREQE